MTIGKNNIAMNATDNTRTYKYFAFISYSSRDIRWGKRLQKKLENYSMPAAMCRKHGWTRKPINPLFFAPSDIQPGGLSEELKARLRISKNLIVIGTPASAKSKWVAAEITYFRSLGREKNIHVFIVEGEPHSGNPDTECFNSALNKLGMPEILGANIHAKNYRWGWVNREYAYVQLITKLLGVEVDDIWQRHKRWLIEKIILWTVGAMCVVAAIAGVWLMNQPIDIRVSLEETSVYNSHLPPMQDASVTFTFDNEIKTDTVSSFSDNVLFRNIPHHFLGKRVRAQVACRDFISIDTVFILTKDLTLGLCRNPEIYGNIRFRLWNPMSEKTVPGCEVRINGIETVSDENGRVTLFIPLESQRTRYNISAEIPLQDTTVHMPCGKNDVILACPVVK